MAEFGALGHKLGIVKKLSLFSALLAACGSSTAPSAIPPGATDDVQPSTASAPVPSADATATPGTPTAALAPTTSSSVAPVAPEAPVPPLPRGTAVLHVGDSFVHGGFTQALRPKLEAMGVRYEVHAEQSTNSLDWAKRLPALVSSTQPDLVIVTLGGNEIGSKHLDVQARAVRRIVETIGGRPCIWTTPPLWREEDGLFDTIQANVAPCRFFETDVIVGKKIPRREDKIHPTPDGGAMWASAFLGWLEKERRGSPLPWSLAEAPTAERTPSGHRRPVE